LGKAVDPPLRVREDWWVFEKSLIKVKGKTVGLSKEIENWRFSKKSKEKHIKAN